LQTLIEIPQAEFEVTPQAFAKHGDKNRVFVNEKQEQLLEFQETICDGRILPLSLTAGYNYIGQGPKMPWGAKPSDGVYY
jgi:hypothetical protein